MKKRESRTRRKYRKVDPAELYTLETETGAYLCFEDAPLLLPNGTPVVHRRLSFLEHIREEFSGHGKIKIDAAGKVIEPNVISSYNLLDAQRLLENTQNHTFRSGFKVFLICDPCLSRCAGPEALDQIARWQPLFRFYKQHGFSPPDFAQVPVELNPDDDVSSVVRKRIESTHFADNPSSKECIVKAIEFAEAIERVALRLGPEELAVMFYLFCINHGILFPLLLSTGDCSVAEYANGLMASHGLLTTAFSGVTERDHQKMWRAFSLDAQIAVRFLEKARSPWASDIKKGEDETREFKATFRFDLATAEHNKELEHSVLKNVAAFLNSQGGTLFVGIADSGEVTGIELDEFENNDKWALHLVSRIGGQIGKRFLTLCQIDFDTLHGRSVARIRVQKSCEPAFLDETPLKSKGVKNAFFVRGGPSAQKLPDREISLYCSQRFPDFKFVGSEL